jgi:polysaccharide export outer membrane protein
VSSYTVNSDGNIDFPIIGTIHIGGLTRSEISEKIKQELLTRQLLKSPVVTVDFRNAYFSVSGEVNAPGRYLIDRDQLTVIDALAKASDLSIYGDRATVKVIRTENGKQKAYMLDLTSAEQLASSPAYYIQQSDVIYVSPNKTRARQSTVNGNNLISYSFWLSLASVLTSMAVLIFK